MSFVYLRDGNILPLVQGPEGASYLLQTAPLLSDVSGSSAFYFPMLQDATVPDILACRVCLSTDTKLYKIFNNKLAQMYGEVVGTNVLLTDGLPQYVCFVCSVLLRRAASFRAKCQQTLQILQSMRVNTPVLTTEVIKTKTLPKANWSTTKPLVIEIKPEAKLKFNPITKNETITIEIMPDNIEEHIQKTDTTNMIQNTKETITFADDLQEIVQDIDVIDIPDDIDDVLEEEDDLHDIDDDEIDAYIWGKPKKGPKPITINNRLFENTKVIAERWNMNYTLLSKEEQLADMEARKECSRYKESEFKCDLCIRPFSCAKTLKDHVELFHKSGSFVCDCCHFSCRTKTQLARHHHNQHAQRFQCRSCNYVGRGRIQAQRHYKSHGEKNKKHKCPLCWMTFATLLLKLEHMRSHNNLNCNICGKRFKFAKTFVDHITTDHSQALDVRCESCGAHFLTADVLATHQDSSTNIVCDINKRPCGHCGDSFENYESLTTHIWEIHGRNCYKCDTKFTTKSQYKQHYREAHNPRQTAPRKSRKGLRRRPKNMLCETCGYSTNCWETLRTHQYAHTGQRPHACPMCDKGFKSRYALRAHLNSHSDVRPFQCADCPKTFKYKFNMERHVFVHMNIRNIRCPVCSKMFKHNVNLLQHINYVHLKRYRSQPKAPKVIDETNGVRKRRRRTKKTKDDQSIDNDNLGQSSGTRKRRKVNVKCKLNENAKETSQIANCNVSDFAYNINDDGVPGNADAYLGNGDLDLRLQIL